jgi:hypothetical protein
MTILTAACTTRSVTVGLPRGRFSTLPGFFNPHPFDWLGLIGALVELPSNGEPPALAVLFKAPYRDAVYATGPGVSSQLFPCQLKGSFCADLVDQAEPLVSFQPPCEGCKR